jgi:hypothetical protein
MKMEKMVAIPNDNANLTGPGIRHSVTPKIAAATAKATICKIIKKKIGFI